MMWGVMVWGVMVWGVMVWGVMMWGVMVWGVMITLLWANFKKLPQILSIQYILRTVTAGV